MSIVNAVKRQIIIEEQGQDMPVITAKPVLYFMAISGNTHQQIAAYSEADARERATILFGRMVRGFYQVFPCDVDYSAYPDIQVRKDLALGGFGGRAA
jgi:hypothetical protein